MGVMPMQQHGKGTEQKPKLLPSMSGRGKKPNQSKQRKDK